jgi:hypothetical protein
MLQCCAVCTLEEKYIKIRIIYKYSQPIKGKAVPLQAWSGPEGSFIVKVKQPRYRPGVAQKVPLKVKQPHYRPGVAQRVPL